MGKNKPPGFEPQHTAYEAKYRDEGKPLVCAFFGVQQRGGEAGAARAALAALLAGSDGPDNLEQGRHADVAGTQTHVSMAYWRDPARFERWHASPALAAWIEDRSDPMIGRWTEVARVSPRALDTLIADETTHWGLAQLADSIAITHDHGYWGGTRDRIQIAATEDISNPDGPAMPTPPKPSRGLGEIVDVVMPPNVVVARGGPDWSRCLDIEREEFLNSVYPAYVRGGRYLREAPEESGCYAASLIQEVDREGREVERNHLIAYFVQLDDLERWTKTHPTHIEIFARFMQMFRRINRMPQTNLYHEVSVIPAGHLTATYVNCLPDTGLLRFGLARGGDAGTERIVASDREVAVPA